MQDISINIGEFKLNLRVGAIIEHEGKILFHKSPKEDYYAVVGGRLQTGETTKEAIERELKEELGKEIETIKPLGIVENFFYSKGKKYHEILFLHQAEFKKIEDQKILQTMQTVEKGEDTIYEWIDKKDIEKTDIRPIKIKELLKFKTAGFLVNREY